MYHCRTGRLWIPLRLSWYLSVVLCCLGGSVVTSPLTCFLCKCRANFYFTFPTLIFQGFFRSFRFPLICPVLHFCKYSPYLLHFCITYLCNFTLNYPPFAPISPYSKHGKKNHSCHALFSPQICRAPGSMKKSAAATLPAGRLLREPFSPFLHCPCTRTAG